MKYSEKMPIQSKCLNCPQLKTFVERHDKTDAAIQEVTLAGIDGTVSDVLKQVLVMSEEFGEEEASAIVSENDSDIRQGLVEYVDMLTSMNDAQEAAITDLQNACEDGAMRLRARRNGKQVTVAVCMSEGLSRVFRTSKIEPALIERKDIAD